MEQNYKCELCDLECSRSDALRNHVKNEHDSAPTKSKYLCPMCETSFGYRSNWTTHMKRTHKMTDEEVNDVKKKAYLRRCFQTKRPKKVNYIKIYDYFISKLNHSSFFIARTGVSQVSSCENNTKNHVTIDSSKLGNELSTNTDEFQKTTQPFFNPKKRWIQASQSISSPKKRCVEQGLSNDPKQQRIDNDQNQLYPNELRPTVIMATYKDGSMPSKCFITNTQTNSSMSVAENVNEHHRFLSQQAPETFYHATVSIPPGFSNPVSEYRFAMQPHVYCMGYEYDLFNSTTFARSR